MWRNIYPIIKCAHKQIKFFDVLQHNYALAHIVNSLYHVDLYSMNVQVVTHQT